MFRFLLLSLLFLAGSAPAEVRLLTSIKPLQLIAAAVQDGVGRPDVLLPPGASPHHYALRPSDLRKVREVELFYWVGPDLETFLPRVLDGRSSPTVMVQDLPGLHLRHFGEGQSQADHGDGEHEHDHDHRPGMLDAHLWLLPENARVIATRMAADLSAADPGNAPRYQANLQAFERRLAALDQRLRQRLAGVSGKPYFVFHEAFDYFEAAYGLQHRGVFSAAAEVQPGARQVAEMREKLQRAGPACVFSEPPWRPKLSETLTEGLPVKLAELDALGATRTADADGYEQLLDELADTLAGCLEGL
jgi:zinc transport system substrate-binding protein